MTWFPYPREGFHKEKNENGMGGYGRGHRRCTKSWEITVWSTVWPGFTHHYSSSSSSSCSIDLFAARVPEGATSTATLCKGTQGLCLLNSVPFRVSVLRQHKLVARHKSTILGKARVQAHMSLSIIVQSDRGSYPLERSHSSDSLLDLFLQSRNLFLQVRALALSRNVFHRNGLHPEAPEEKAKVQ